MAASSRGVKVLIVALIISICVLLHLELRVTSLMSEADDARLLADDAVRERDRMKLHVKELERGASKVIEREVPRAVQKKEPVTLATTLSTPRTAAVESPGHEEAQAMGKKFEYHFKVDSLCLSD